MIYLKNNNEQQTIFIPRNELQKEAYITSTKTYEDGYREGLEDGKEQQKDQLLNLYVTENGQYEREDGWGTVTVDIPIGDCPECEDCSGAYDEGYEIGKNEGYEDGFQDGYDQGQADCPQGDDCPELTTIDITENGSYEGAFNLVNVNVPQDGGECNLEYKMIAPSMGDRDDNGYIIVEEGEGYNGLSRVVIDPFRIYNEGIEEGKNQGGGSGDCNIQNQKRIDLNGEWETYYPDEGYDGIYEVVVEAGQKAEEWRDEGRNSVRDKIETIDITENGRYSVDDLELIDSIKFDGNSYFDTGIVPTEQTKIEVMFKCQGENWYEDMYILGCSQLSLHIGGTALNGKWAEAQSGNIPYVENEWSNVTLDRDNLCSNNRCAEWNEGNKDSGWEGYNETIKIGKLGDEQLFKQQISYVKIWVNKDDDSTITLFRPKDMAQGGFGMVNSEGAEYDYVENLGEGTTTFMSEWKRKYGEGWREINVNVDGGSCNLINPIVYSETEGNTIYADNINIPTFVYEGRHYYNVLPLYMAEYEEFKIQIRFQPWDNVIGEPVNIFGCEDTDWDDTTFGARTYEGQIYFRMSGQDVAYPYNNLVWYDVEMGYNSSKRWIIVNGETIMETDHAFFNKPSQTFMIGAINSGGNAFRPFFGKIGVAYIEADGNQVWLLPKEEGQMDIYWNSRNHPWDSISGENNALFEFDWMSGDGMKTITWLGTESCHLVAKWITPSMTERDDNGYIVVDGGEGFDGLSEVVIDPTTIYNEGYTDGYYEGSNQLSNNVLEGDVVLSFQLNDNNFPDLRNDGKGIFMWDGFKVPLYIKRPNGCGELYLSGNYDKNIAPSLQSKFFQDDDYAKIEKLTINFYHIIPNNIVNVVNLKELHLTERVEIIDKNAFQDVSNLKTIYCHYDGDAYMYATKESFVGLPNNGTLYIKKSAQPPWGWIEDLGWTIVNI